MKKSKLYYLCALTFLLVSGCQNPSDMSQEKSNAKGNAEIEMLSLGQLEGGSETGKEISSYRIQNANGISMRVMNYGCIIMDLLTPDRDGNLADITLGYDSLEGYRELTPYFGAIVGRYGNRIAKGKFEVDGESFELALNNGPNALHGGLVGFDKRVWDLETFQGDDHQGMTCSLISPDGEEGYPGELSAKVTYTLNSNNELIIDYLATTDKATPINLTQHAYFNLSAFENQDVLDHMVQIHADQMTPVDATLIPTGDLASVTGTAFDFNEPELIGARIDSDDEQIVLGGGYDHNFVVRGEMGTLRPAARVVHEGSGRVLEVETTEPGVQFYTGNFLDGAITGKNGIVYNKRSGFCLETQHYPNSPNQPNFPSTILRPGEEYVSQTIFRFSTE